jgi:hypothetical protein
MIFSRNNNHRRLLYTPALIGGVVSLVWWFLVFVVFSVDSPNGFRDRIGAPLLIFLAGFTPPLALTSLALKQTSSSWNSWLFVGITYGALSGFSSGTLCGIIILALASPAQNTFDIPNIIAKTPDLLIESAVFGGPTGFLVGGLAGGLIALIMKSLHGHSPLSRNEDPHE